MKYNEEIERQAAQCCQSALGLIKGTSKTEAEVLFMIVSMFYDKMDISSKEKLSKVEFSQYVSSLLNPDHDHLKIADPNLEPWLDKEWRDTSGNHWSAYRQYLIDDGKSFAISSIDTDTYNILDYCHNPKISGKWDRRGLVYGHVQSGKTANFIGLINKAFDVGYRLVIVFTGMTEDLRSQTQKRVNYGVTGRDGLGVGQYLNQDIKSMTNEADLSRSNLDTIKGVFNTNDKNILVLKKNKSVLESLIELIDYKSLSQNNDVPKLTGVPTLIIDDEADNASIQSLSKKDFDKIKLGETIITSTDDDEELSIEDEKMLADAKNVTIKTINRYLRVVLSLLGQKTFIGYTATPYSILAQSYEALGKKVEIRKLNKEFDIDKNSDLFPEHFIYPLTPGIKYMGISKMFGVINPSGAMVKEPLPLHVALSETEKSYYYEEKNSSNINSPVGGSYNFKSIPPVLRESIIFYITTIYVRYHRSMYQHNTMLVHTSHLIRNIDYLADKIEKFRDELIINLLNNPKIEQAVRSNLSFLKDNATNSLYHSYFNESESSYTFPSAIDKNVLKDIIESITIVSYHSSKADDLLHKNHKLPYPDLNTEGNKDKYKNYIVVGGNRIARGFTLEGLIVSYFVRKTSNQDTLYQMGRWFGYRPKYEDLIRLYMPLDRREWFKDISNLEYQLRTDLNQANTLQSDEFSYTPSSWGIKMSVAKSFSGLVKKLGITDRNRLRRTQLKLMSVSRRTLPVSRISNSTLPHADNLELTKKFLSDIWDNKCHSGANIYPENDYNLNFINVNKEVVLKYISGFKFEESLQKEFDLLKDYILTYSNQVNDIYLSDFSIVLKQIKSRKKEIFDIEGTKITSNKRSISGKSEDNYYNIPSILDGDKDNTFDIITQSNIDEYKKDSSSQPKLRRKYRDESRIPLMIIALISGELSIKDDSPLKDSVIPILYFFLPAIGERKLVLTRNN